MHDDECEWMNFICMHFQLHFPIFFHFTYFLFAAAVAAAASVSLLSCAKLKHFNLIAVYWFAYFVQSFDLIWIFKAKLQYSVRLMLIAAIFKVNFINFDLTILDTSFNKCNHGEHMCFSNVLKKTNKITLKRSRFDCKTFTMNFRIANDKKHIRKIPSKWSLEQRKSHERRFCLQDYIMAMEKVFHLFWHDRRTESSLNKRKKMKMYLLGFIFLFSFKHYIHSWFMRIHSIFRIFNFITFTFFSDIRPTFQQQVSTWKKRNRKSDILSD